MVMLPYLPIKERTQLISSMCHFTGLHFSSLIMLSKGFW